MEAVWTMSTKGFRNFVLIVRGWNVCSKLLCMDIICKLPSHCAVCKDQGKIQRCHCIPKKSGFLLCVFSSDGMSMILISGHLCSSGELSRHDKQVEGGSRSWVNCKLWNCKGAEIQIGSCGTQVQTGLHNVGQQGPETKVWLDLKKSLFLAWQESAGGLGELTLVSMFLMTERAILWARPSALYSLDLGSSSR